MSETFDKRKMDQMIEDLFTSEWNKLVRYTKAILRRYEPQIIDCEGRAEDVVQELFYITYRKIEEIKADKNPKGWLYTALNYKIKEILREDRQWTKCLLLLPPEELVDPPEIEEMSQLIPKDDYLLLRHLYIDGYSYDELCEKLGCTRSCLAMRVHRIKAKFKEKYADLFLI